MDADLEFMGEHAFTSDDFRKAMGRFATGICIVTAQPPGFGPIGLTVNSFASVSLEPALVLWCLGKASDTFDAFLKTDHFAVNILDATQEAYSRRFAARDDHKLEDGEFEVWETGAPILTETMAQFDCVVHDRLDGGDHIIFLGEVKRLAEHDRPPLVYSGGQYGHVVKDHPNE